MDNKKAYAHSGPLAPPSFHSVGVSHRPPLSPPCSATPVIQNPSPLGTLEFKTCRSTSIVRAPSINTLITLVPPCWALSPPLPAPFLLHLFRPRSDPADLNHLSCPVHDQSRSTDDSKRGSTINGTADAHVLNPTMNSGRDKNHVHAQETATPSLGTTGDDRASFTEPRGCRVYNTLPLPVHPTMSSPNVLPNWWSFSFIGLQAAALLPLTYQHVTNPLQTFVDAYPLGYDKATDSLKSSPRVDMVVTTNAQSYLMIAALFIGCTLFARNSLKGQPKLQQRLVSLPIYVGLFSDLWLYAMMALKLPPGVLGNPSAWTPSMKGIIYGLPVATALKAVWLLGIGRDVV